MTCRWVEQHLWHASEGARPEAGGRQALPLSWRSHVRADMSLSICPPRPQRLPCLSTLPSLHTPACLPACLPACPSRCLPACLPAGLPPTSPSPPGASSNNTPTRLPAGISTGSHLAAPAPTLPHLVLGTLSNKQQGIVVWQAGAGHVLRGPGKGGGVDALGGGVLAPGGGVVRCRAGGRGGEGRAGKEHRLLNQWTYCADWIKCGCAKDGRRQCTAGMVATASWRPVA
jgi:hypothetical protein